jgi:hypothetical protein
MRRLSPVILVVTLAASLAACGGGSSSGGGGTPTKSAAPVANGISNPTQAKAQITALYNKFFAAPPSVAKTMLEDGPQLGAAFKAAEKLKGKATESSKTDTVKITSASTATVTFDLYTSGKKVLTGSDGNAVFVDGQWKVAKTTFCTLVSLGGTTPKGC